MMLGSIIIVTYGQRELTEQCLRSLDAALGEKLGRTWELVLVDNKSPDDTPEMLAGWADRATVLLLDENRNFSGGCNTGAEAATGEVLVFLNNDTEVPPDALETLAQQALEADVGAVGCRLLFPNGTVQHAGVAFLRGTAFGEAVMPQHVFHQQDQSLAVTQAIFEADSVTAACMAVRAEVFREVHGFDEGYRNGLEDIDLCLKIRSAGKRVVYRGDVTVIHHEGATRGRGAEIWATEAKLAAARNNDELFLNHWAASLEQDDELAAELWDGSLMNLPPQRSGGAGNTVVIGQPSGFGSAADEARAMIAAIAADGGTPVSIDSPYPNVVARVREPLATVLNDARLRTADPYAQPILVPSGRHDSFHVEQQAIVRLASAQTTLPLADCGSVWACSPALRQALIADGLDPSMVHVVPSPLPPYPTGPGGAGVLMVLPTHDPRLSAALIQSLKTLPRTLPLRILPTAYIRGLAAELADRLPHAELLAPCSDEAGFSELAGTADVVAAFDGSDSFERHALVAARAGAAVVGTRRDGPAAWVLGDHIVWSAEDFGELPSHLADLAADGGSRADRSAHVADRCAWTPPPMPPTRSTGSGGFAGADAGERRADAPNPVSETPSIAVASTPPLVSVVVTAFNQAHFLPAALDSALGQRDPGGPVEVIVIDDGSTDHTPSVLASYGDRIRSHRQPTGGLIAAVDRGLELACGRYVALLDADDEMPAERLHRQASVLSAHAEVGLVHSDMELIDRHGSTIAPSFLAHHGLETIDGRVLGRLLAQNFVSRGATMFRTALLPALHPIAPESAYPDWWIAACVAAVAEIRLVPGIGNRRRDHGESTGLIAGSVAGVQLLELPWRRWLLENLVGDDTITASEIGWAVNQLLGGMQEAFAADPDATSMAASAREARSWMTFSTLPPTGPGAPRSRALARALAARPRDATLTYQLRQALIEEMKLQPPPPSPPLISLRTRSRVTLGWVNEVLRRPELLHAFARSADGDDDRSLVLMATPAADLRPLVEIFEDDPELGSEGCDVTVIPEPATQPAVNLLRARADSCLTADWPASPYRDLPTHPASAPAIAV